MKMFGRRIQKAHFLRQSFSSIGSNKVAIVTGGSGDIGKEICLSLASKGCKVIIHYNTNFNKAKEIANEIHSKWSSIGSEGLPIQADCTNLDSVKSLFQQTVTHYNQIDLLINNVGIKKDKLAISMSSQDFNDVIEVNLNSTFYCSQIAFSYMMKRRSGRIINISSIVGQLGNPGQCNYSASKGAIISLTKSLAKEYAARNVQVNVVCPGYVESEMTSQLSKDQIIQSIPLKRFGRAEEIASLVSFLGLDMAGEYMTGHCYNIDGGLAIGAT